MSQTSDTQAAPPPGGRDSAFDPPRAPAFIVTIYGDVVEPRGGTLWMGTLIDCCADHGISESLVRTAVSRLVGAGRLEGFKIGRRSYYRLSASAQAEFRAAARLLFAPPEVPATWLLWLSDGPRDADLPRPWVRLGSAVALAPNRSDVARPAGLAMEAAEVPGTGDMARFAAQHWPLDEVGEAYRAFLDRYAPLAGEAGRGAGPGEAALALRLRLVHDYRQAALADPRLPRAALPPAWPAEAARRLFVRVYCALSPEADRHIGRTFHNEEGLLPERTEATARRLDQLGQG